MYQCILSVRLWNDWSKVTYSQVHGIPVLKALSFKSFSWISATAFADIYCFIEERFHISSSMTYMLLLLLSWCLALAKKYKVVGVVNAFMMGTTLINLNLLLLLLLACNWCLKFDIMQVSTLHMMFFWWSGHLINLHIYLNFLEIHPCYLLYTGREWFKKMSSSFC